MLQTYMVCIVVLKLGSEPLCTIALLNLQVVYDVIFYLDKNPIKTTKTFPKRSF